MIDAECLGGVVKIDRVAAQTLFVAGIQCNAQIKTVFPAQSRYEFSQKSFI